MRSLKDRIRRVRLLLNATGILQRHDITDEMLSDSDDEGLEDEILDAERHPDSRRSSNDSVASEISEWAHAARFVGDIEVAPIFKSHESDETRYFGS